jgi:hypothetical protein
MMNGGIIQLGWMNLIQFIVFHYVFFAILSPNMTVITAKWPKVMIRMIGVIDYWAAVLRCRWAGRIAALCQFDRRRGNRSHSRRRWIRELEGEPVLWVGPH